MPLTCLPHAVAGLVASVAVAIAFVAPANADPMNPIPGNGFFLVGIDIAPGLYHTGGTGRSWDLDKRRADTGVDVLVVYVQHA